jgi:acyl-CoA synthetase (AMP-forming)/AMP-acid ligase II
MAAKLMQMGVTATDRVAVILPNRPEFLYVWFAVVKIGAALVGLNYRYPQDEVIHMCNVSEPSVMICMNQFLTTDYSKFFLEIKDKLPSIKHYVFVGQSDFPGAVNFDSLLDEDIDTSVVSRVSSEVKPENDCFIIFTSGTTGKPKGAVLTQKSIMAHLRPYTKSLELKIGDSWVCGLPLNHVGGLTCNVLPLISSGAVIVFLELFTPQAWLTLMQKHRAVIMSGVPSMFDILFAAYPDLKREDLPDAEFIGYGGSSASADLLAKLIEVFNLPIINCYGSTEVSGFVTFSTRRDPLEKAHTVGRVAEGAQLKIVDPITKQELPRGEIGAIAVKAENLFDRYLNLPEETAKAYDSDGWFYMGDLGYLDEDGFLTISGRTKEMYINGGFNVYPKEIEDRLTEYPGVLMAAVVGIPDGLKGEAGVAFIVPNPGATVTEDELRGLCKKKLADYKVPKRVFIVDEFPLTPLGKIHKPSLAEMAIQRIK